ncbi:MAG: Lrp/AsnC family transcriptional regulator [Pseudomonadota bacterium]
MTEAILDETDLSILSYLSEDARISNREIALQLNIAEGTVRARVKRMVDEKAIRFTALTRELDVADPLLCYVGLRVDLTLLSSVAEELCELQNVRFVATTLGRFDVLVIVLVDSVEALSAFVSENVMKITGVRRVETSIATQTLKFDYRWGKVL